MTSSHVLARKYRPQTFNDLIGQEALVQTIGNAIAHNRLANAYMLTGIRGIGKTTSARIIAKGLNCIGPDGNGPMTPNPCGQCKHCREIAADSHIDVIEIDAASNTGVDNVREIIDGAKYNPVSARFKIYIIDEVHMLSKAAFNALLKTLEEPPERIKFIFATTEIRKVPVTILSRCQRFDLRRLDEETLTKHLKNISESENATVEDEALRLIARAGDGSVRDSLSLLDQAITQFDMHVSSENVRQMMGLSDRAVLFDLFESLMSGQIEKALSLLAEQYKSGADSLSVIQDMLDLTHWLTRVKITPKLAEDITIPENERVRGQKMAQGLTMGALSAAWQVLLKGLDEVRRADNPLQVLEMVLIRLAFLADLPPIEQIVDDIKKNGIAPSAAATASQHPQQMQERAASLARVQPLRASDTAVPAAAHTLSAQSGETQAATGESQFKTLADIVAFARSTGERILAFNIENFVRASSLKDKVLSCSFADGAPTHLSADIIAFLNKRAGEVWRIEQQNNVQTSTLHEQKEQKKNLLIEELSHEEIVSKTLASFSGAKVVRVRQEADDKEAAPDKEHSESENDG